MTEGSQQEQREREPRRAVRVGLTFEDFRSFVTTYASNISMGGMFIRASNPLSPGTLCNLDVKLKDGFPLIRGLSEVAWIRERAEGPDRPPGMGIRFRDLEQKSRDLIYEIVERRMADGGSSFEPPDLDELLESAEKRRERSDEDDAEEPAQEATADPLGALPDLDLGAMAKREESEPELFEALPELEEDTDGLPPLDAAPVDEAPLPAAPPEPAEPTDSAQPATPAEVAEATPLPEPAAAGDSRSPLNLDDLFPPLPREDDTPPPPRNLPERGAASSADDEDERPVSPLRLAPALLVIAIGATLGVLWMSGTLPEWLGLVDDIGSISTHPSASGPAMPAPEPGEPADSSNPPEGTSARTPERTPEPVATDAGPASTTPPAPTPPPTRAAASNPFTVVQDIRAQAAGSLTRVTLVCNGTMDIARVQRERLGGASPRVVLRIQGVQRAYNPNRIEVGSPQLQRIRLGYHPGNELHVVLDLAAAGVRVASADARDNLLILTLEGE